MQLAAAAVASERPPNQAWRDAVSTFWNTVDTIGVVVEFLAPRLLQLLDLRRVHSRWNLAVCDSVRRLKCKEGTNNAMVRARVDTFCEVRSLSLAGCETVTVGGFSHLARLGGLTELDLSRTNVDATALEVVTRLPRLTSLIFFSCDFIADDGVVTVCAMIKLTSLDVRGCSHLTRASLERLGAALPKLTSLCIDGALAKPDAMQHLRRFPQLTSLTAHGVSDTSIAHVRCLPGLAALDVSSSPELTDNILASVCCSLQRLTSLCLRGDRLIAEAAMESVSQLPALTSLDVGEIRYLSATGVAAISKLTGLKTLRLDRVWSVSSSSLVHVAKLVALTELNVGYCGGDSKNISDVGVQSLAPLTRLRTLDLSGCSITDLCTATLGSFKELRTLKLKYCSEKLSDAGLANIAQLTRLTELDLRGTCPTVSTEAVNLLRAAIPGVVVVH